MQFQEERLWAAASCLTTMEMCIEQVVFLFSSWVLGRSSFFNCFLQVRVCVEGWGKKWRRIFNQTLCAFFSLPDRTDNCVHRRAHHVRQAHPSQSGLRRTLLEICYDGAFPLFFIPPHSLPCIFTLSRWCISD